MSIFRTSFDEIRNDLNKNDHFSSNELNYFVVIFKIITLDI